MLYYHSSGELVHDVVITGPARNQAETVHHVLIIET